jgi:hypothetical protein
MSIDGSDARSHGSGGGLNREIPRPWPLLVAPPGLDGTAGSNRLPIDAQILKLSNDLDVIRTWLNRGGVSDESRRIYRGAMEKFVNWAWLNRKKAVSSLDPVDFEMYADFLTNPQPSTVWVSCSKVSRDSAAWAPFIGPLNNKAITLNLAAVRSLICWMATAGYAKMQFVGGTREARETRLQASMSPRSAVHVTAGIAFDLRDVQSVWAALHQAQRSVRERTLLQFLLQYQAGLSAAELVRIAFSHLRMPKSGPWTLLVPGRAPNLQCVALLPMVRAALTQYLAIANPAPAGQLLNVQASDIQKANERFFSLAAHNCREVGDTRGEDRLQRLSANSLKYAFAQHAATFDVENVAWHLVAARQGSARSSVLSHSLGERLPVTAERYSEGVQAMQEVLNLFQAPAAARHIHGAAHPHPSTAR